MQIDWLRDVGIADLADILLVSVLLYLLVEGLRRTRAAFVLGGIVIVGGVLVIARLAGLALTTFLFQSVVTVVLLGLVIIFQEELRRLFEQVAIRSIRRRQQANAKGAESSDVETLVATLSDLARDRIGALVVLQGRDLLSRHIDGGEEIGGLLSVPLLKSIFDPHSEGHDGAVIVAGGRIERFACHLPLSTDEEQLRSRGTRHAAALGLAEETDALCVVVSEERGTISVAEAGRLEVLDGGDALRVRLERFFAEKRPREAPRGRRVRDLVVRNFPRKVAAVGISALLWFFFVHESVVEYRGFIVAVETTGLQQELEVRSLEPSRVKVIVSGPRRAFYFLGAQDFGLSAKLFEFGVGQHEIALAASDVTLPSGLEFVNIIPRTVDVRIERATAGAAGP